MVQPEDVSILQHMELLIEHHGVCQLANCHKECKCSLETHSCSPPIAYKFAIDHIEDYLAQELLNQM